MTVRTSTPSPSDSRTAYALSLTPLPERSRLQADWLTLEARSRASFFTSWAWIGVWLDTLPPTVQPRLLQAHSGPVRQCRQRLVQAREQPFGGLVAAQQRQIAGPAQAHLGDQQTLLVGRVQGLQLPQCRRMQALERLRGTGAPGLFERHEQRVGFGHQR